LRAGLRCTCGWSTAAAPRCCGSDRCGSPRRPRSWPTSRRCWARRRSRAEAGRRYRAWVCEVHRVTIAPIESVPDEKPASPARSKLKRELLAALAVAVAVALSGLAMGPLWSAVAPHAPFVMTPYGPTTVESEPAQCVADDVWYGFLALGAGLPFAILVWLLLRRYRGVLVLAGLAVGCAA